MRVLRLLKSMRMIIKIQRKRTRRIMKNLIKRKRMKMRKKIIKI